MPFQFTADQIQKLKGWRSALESEQSQKWYRHVKENIAAGTRLLSDAGFQNGIDLTPDQLDDFFRLVKILAGNRALANILYKRNTLEEFNKQLRFLFYGKTTILDRVESFLTLGGVQEVTMSEFLCFSNIYEFPLFSSQTYDVLEIDASQEQEALKQALLEHSLTDPSKYSEITRSYLVHWLIFREAKNLLQLESYPQVNELLWLARPQEQEVGGEIPTQNVTSISMESDLRDFIASNPHVISKGLELVQKEYPVEAIGRIDVLLKDKNGKFVVVETKKGRESDKVVGQILRYIGWIKRNLGDCTGIIVVGEPDDKLEYAVEAISGLVKVRKYKVEFELSELY